MKDLETLLQWQCSLQESSQRGAARLDHFTVGNQFLLSCRAPSVKLNSLNAWQENLKFSFPIKENEYSLYPLQMLSQSEDHLQLIVTGYKPGEYAVENIVLSDGTQSIRLGPLQWKIISVLDGKKEPVQMVPPFGPYQIGYPNWYYMGWIGIITAILLAIGGWFFRYYRHQKMVKRLMLQRTSYSPYTEWNKGLRQLIRRVDISQAKEGFDSAVSEIEQFFRMYLLRAYLVPTFEWSDSKIIRKLKTSHFLSHSEIINELAHVFAEFKKMRNLQSIGRLDWEQLIDMTRKLIGRMEQIKEVSDHLGKRNLR